MNSGDGPVTEQSQRSRGVVAMVVRNPVTHDSRVRRAADALVGAGYAVVVVGRLREGYEADEMLDGVRVVRLRSEGRALRILAATLRIPGRMQRRAQRTVRLFTRPSRARNIWTRLRRQWYLLCASGSPLGTLRAYAKALRAPLSALLSTMLLPFAIVRGLIERRPPSPPAANAQTPTVPEAPFRALHNGLRKVLRRPKSLASAWAFQRAAAKLMSSLEPVAYHCHDFNTAWTGRIARRRYRAPVIYDAHEIYGHQNLLKMTRRRKLLVWLVEGATVRRATAVIAANGSYADHIAKTYRVARPAVVRNIPRTTGASVAGTLIPSLEGNDRIVLYVGNIAKGRGIGSAIRAMPLIPGARLVLMGPLADKDFRDSCETLALDLGVSDRVVFEPPVAPEHITGVAARAAVGLCLIENVCLSYYLTLPNKIFECMHAGLPVVSSDFPEFGPLVERYGFGLTCDPVDPEAIAAAINKILGDPTLAEEMRSRALSAAGEHTWKRESQVITDLYEGILPA